MSDSYRYFEAHQVPGKVTFRYKRNCERFMWGLPNWRGTPPATHPAPKVPLFAATSVFAMVHHIFGTFRAALAVVRHIFGDVIHLFAICRDKGLFRPFLLPLTRSAANF